MTSKEQLKAKGLVDDMIIEIRSQRFSIDWVYEKVHKVNVKDIVGFELHYRGDSWHVIVVTRQESHNENIYAPRYFEYELDHWVYPSEAKKLYNNPDAVILRIVNGWSTKGFQKQLSQLTHE